MDKQVGSARLEIVANGGLDLVVAYDAGDREPWVGIASFPWEMEDEALSWMDRIRSENDIEDLLRQWAPQETWWAFQRLRNAAGT